MKIVRMIRYMFRYLYAFSPAKIIALNYRETIDYLVQHKLSLIRWGDGETSVLLGKDIEYQVSTPELRQKMSDIVETYNQKGPERAGYLLAMPLKFLLMNGFGLLQKKIWISCWVNTRYIFKRFFDHKKIYGELSIFSAGMDTYFTKIWEGAEYIIFVHCDIQFYTKFLETYGKESFFVQIPPRDSFADYRKIEGDIVHILEGNNLDVKKTCILISAGPAAKVITYDLAQQGYLCIDTGHCWDSPPLSRNDLWVGQIRQELRYER